MTDTLLVCMPAPVWSGNSACRYASASPVGMPAVSGDAGPRKAARLRLTGGSAGTPSIAGQRAIHVINETTLGIPSRGRPLG